MITKRTLEQWRKDALRITQEGTDALVDAKYYAEAHQRILRLTSILLDQHLMKR
jgi:hypothetical protein